MQCAQDHDLIVAADLLERALQQSGRLFGIAGEPFFIGAHDPAWRILETFAVWIVARPADERADGVFGFGPGWLQVPPMRQLHRERPL